MRRLWALVTVLSSSIACEEPTPVAPPVLEPAPEPPVVAAPEPPGLDTLAPGGEGQAAMVLPPEYGREDWRASFGSDDERGLVVIAKDESETAPKVRLVLFGEPTVGTYPVVIEAARGNRTQVVTVALDHQPTLRVLGGEVVLSAVTENELRGTVELEVRDAMTPSRDSRVRGSFSAQHDRFYDAQLDHERAIREQLRRR
ncbi:MAG: hypothetical protein H6721_20920 [Sandaracinus sp.]|nr:hypothetical protein [Sandaracinus sp.]MCB9616968.1 hypothetical protein [Sandaracinus sp.]MCB9617856.1 hypothetical protein [Sandaracinus sp.]MCB9634595.1 hypothetical protein [Sandaracinus sp.]